MTLRTLIIVVIATAGAFCQSPDPTYEPLTRAYAALQVKAYDLAISNFEQAVRIAPDRASLHKDLAYAYLKIGENEPALYEFSQAMRLDPGDAQVALEYAFLAYEAQHQAEARRIFDRLRQSGVPTAERAFQNIDRALADGITRWQHAIAMGADDFTTHLELATLAEQRDELTLAADHYERAWRCLPNRRSVLVDLGRVWEEMGHQEDANAAFLAASRSSETRTAEMARELLPDRYPYVPEFQAALNLDPTNVELRRELAYLFLAMGRQAEAELEFRHLSESAGDLLSATQLGFLLHARGEDEVARVLFDRVLAGNDEDLANRVRAVLRVAQVPAVRAAAQPTAVDAKTMAGRSIHAGFLKDAVHYLEMAHTADPDDLHIVLQLGWVHNVLHEDREAMRWFDLARRSADPQVQTEAMRAWTNLHSAAVRFHTSGWLYPVLSSRWRDFFTYGQIRTEARAGSILRPYASLRFIGDTNSVAVSEGRASVNQFLSENSFIFGLGVRTIPWHHMTGWFEAGTALIYTNRQRIADYRGGVSALWQKLPEVSGWFADSSLDALFVSRFNNDFLAYNQSRFGYAANRHLQLYWNANFTIDASREYWANFVETGPGFRVSSRWLPPSMWISGNVVRGAYLVNRANPRRPNFTDARLGIWYAFTIH
jgi:Tfp pilus assembly protein PilF